MAVQVRRHHLDCLVSLRSQLQKIGYAPSGCRGDSKRKHFVCVRPMGLTLIFLNATPDSLDNITSQFDDAILVVNLPSLTIPDKPLRPRRAKPNVIAMQVDEPPGVC